MKKNLVSICITTFNRKLSLTKTLKNVVNQNYKHIEIIIVDDCSNDGTQALIENEFLKYDRRIKYIRHIKNKGLAASRNTAIFNANGEYFTFCDDDDLWKISYVEEFVNIASKYNYNWIFCCGSEYKNFLGAKLETKLNFEGRLKNFLKEGYTPPVSSQFYNLFILKKIKGYNEDVKSGVDHDLWIKLAKIDVNIKYTSKALSMPNVNKNDDRMTTNFQNRINKLRESLCIWKNDLIQMYDHKFYDKFCEAYLYREYYNFMVKYLIEFNLKMIITIFKNISLINFLKMILDIIIKLFNNIIQLVLNKNKIKIKPSLKIDNLYD